MKRFVWAALIAAVVIGVIVIGPERVNRAADDLDAAAEAIPRVAVATGAPGALPTIVRRERDHSAYCARTEQSPPAPSAPFVASGFRLHDADTLIVGEERVRVANLDAPEVSSRARCPEENRRGLEATAEAQRFLAAANTVTIEPDGTRDQFCRIRATVSADGQDLAAHIIERDLGAPWQGRTRDWCAAD